MPPGDNGQGRCSRRSRAGELARILADGTLAVTVTPLAARQDQTTVAARAALLIKERWPESHRCYGDGTGRGSRGRTAVGEVVELAAPGRSSRSQPAGRQTDEWRAD